jgi:5-methylcytosine-specific restriction endonuclease McrA
VSRRGIPTGYRKRLIERADACCEACGRSNSERAEDRLEVDHVLALCLGGGNGLGNLQVLCPSCHREKTRSDMTKYWRRKRAATERKKKVESAVRYLSEQLGVGV